jgi:hypothetical protein
VTLAIPAFAGTIILSMEYDPTGLAWVRLFDNRCLGWLVDETNAVEPAEWDAGTFAQPPPVVTNQHRPIPIIIGSLPSKVVTAPIHSPQWCIFSETDPIVFIPDLTRLRIDDFLTALATNNGAHRLVGSMLGFDRGLLNAYKQWAENNADLAFSGDPPAL